MPSSIINSDDGVISGTSGLKSTGGDDGVLVFQSKGTETARINTDKQIVAAAGTASLPIYSTTGDLNTGIYFPAADNIGFATNGVIRGRWTTDGLCFGTDTAAANALDDYEEGTFTPTIEFGFASAGQTYSSQLGRYTKIGRVVTFIIYCAFSNKGSSTGNASLSGLPFTSANITNFYTTPTIWNNSMTGFTGNVVAYINPNTTRINAIQYQNTGSVSNLTNSNFQNNSDIMFTGFYITD